MLAGRSLVRPLRIPEAALTYLLGLLLLFESSSMLFHLLRVTVYEHIGHVAKAYTGLGLLYSIAIFAFYGMRSCPMNWLFLALLIQGAAAMLWRGHELWKPCVGHFYYWLIMFVGFNFGYSARVRPERVKALLLYFANYALAISLAGFAAIELYRIRTGASLWVGYAGGQLLLPLAVFCLTKRPTSALATLCLLLLSGRRGPFVAGTASLLFLYACRHTRSIWWGTIVSLIPTAMVGWALLAGSQYILQDDFRSADSLAWRLASKWHDTFMIEDDLTRATSGRDLEVEAAQEFFRGGPLDLLIGQGFGWFIDYYGEPQHFLHFSYYNFLITHGVLLGGLLIVVLVRETILCQRTAQLVTRHTDLAWILFVYLVSSLVVSATVSLLSISLLFWILLGIAYQWRHASRVPVAHFSHLIRKSP